jgi:HSP20 family molecular chaperone IbpA
MLFPTVFGEDLMDDYMNDWDELSREIEREFPKKNPLYGRHAKDIMRTDVKQKDGKYMIDVDLPGFKKDEINLSLDNGYINIQTSKSLDKDEKDKKGNVIRRERYSGNMARSFYVGDDMKQEDVHAKYEDGVLHIELPDKAPEQKKLNEAKTIAIEG